MAQSSCNCLRIAALWIDQRIVCIKQFRRNFQRNGLASGFIGPHMQANFIIRARDRRIALNQRLAGDGAAQNIIQLNGETATWTFIGPIYIRHQGQRVA